MKLIAAIRMKNEEWIINYTLSALSEFVDGIVIVDDGSIDNSVNIAKSYTKVLDIHINNPKNEYDIDEPRDWNKLTELAIKNSAEWIFYTDADEMIEPKFKNKVVELMMNKDVGVYQFRKISPWKGLKKYRTDQLRYNHPAKNVLNPILIRFNDKLKWDNARGGFFKKLLKKIIRGENLKPNYGRIFPLNTYGNNICLDDIKSIHFNHIDFDRLLKKQVFYALREKAVRPDKSINDIIDWVSKGWDDSTAEYANIDDSWIWQEYVHLIKYRGI